MHPLIPLAVGVLAVVLFLLSYQQKTRMRIILFNTVSRVLYILQYILLGAYEGAVLDILGAVSSIVAGRKHVGFVKKHARLLLILIDVVIIGAGICLYENVYSLLPIAGVLLHTTAFWIEDEKIIRRVSLAGSPFWFVYNFSEAAYGSALGDLLTIGSILIAMFRYRKKEEPSQNTAEKNP